MITTEKIAELSGHTHSIYTLEKGEKPHLIFSAGSDGYITEWDIEKKEASRVIIKSNIAIYSLLYVEEKGLLFSGDNSGNIGIIDLINLKHIKILNFHSAPVFDLKLSI